MSEYKVLVVDDEELNIELIVDVLEDERYSVETASNGEEAIDKYKLFKPDLVLLDVMMPIKNGYETCEIIRELEAEPEAGIPILFISAKAGLEDKVRGYEVGGNDYITKPFDNAELLLKIALTFKEQEQLKILKASVDDSNAMAYNLMSTASKLGAVGAFLRSAFLCNTVDELFSRFFQLSLGGRLGCTIKIVVDGKTLVVSDDGIDRPIEVEIIRQYVSAEKIFYFGDNRAIFDWSDIVMLVRNVGDEADNIAIMLDGLSASVDFIRTQSLLFDSIRSFQSENSNLKAKASDVADNLEEEIRLSYSRVGANSNLTEAEEENLSAILDKSRALIDEIFLTCRHLEKDLKNAMTVYRSRA